MAGFADNDAQGLVVPGARILVVAAQFNKDIVDLLCQGAMSALSRAQAVATLLSVPGALELPNAAAMALDAAKAAGAPYDGFVSLGCVIRGDTYHFEIVANESARALMDIAVASRLPFGNGILTVENMTQALVRADPLQGDKGADAAQAAVALVALKRGLA